MIYRRHNILDRFAEIIRESHGYEEKFDQASRYCPEPWAQNLERISCAFMGIAIQLELLFPELEEIIDAAGSASGYTLQEPDHSTGYN